MTMALENNIDYSAIIKHEMLRRDLAWKGNERMIAIGHHYAFTLYFSIRSHDALPLTKQFSRKTSHFSRTKSSEVGSVGNFLSRLRRPSLRVTELPWVETGLPERPP